MSAATWSRAWRDASREFWSSEQPSAHFTTSAGSLVAERIAAIVHEVDVRLGHPETLHVIDIGCGDGTLLAHLRDSAAQLMAQSDWNDLLRYQDFGGTREDRAAGVHWLRQRLPRRPLRPRPFQPRSPPVGPCHRAKNCASNGPTCRLTPWRARARAFGPSRPQAAPPAMAWNGFPGRALWWM